MFLTLKIITILTLRSFDAIRNDSPTKTKLASSGNESSFVA